MHIAYTIFYYFRNDKSNRCYLGQIVQALTETNPFENNKKIFVVTVSKVFMLEIFYMNTNKRIYFSHTITMVKLFNTSLRRNFSLFFILIGSIVLFIVSSVPLKKTHKYTYVYAFSRSNRSYADLMLFIVVFKRILLFLCTRDNLHSIH